MSVFLNHVHKWNIGAANGSFDPTASISLSFCQRLQKVFTAGTNNPFESPFDNNANEMAI